MEARSSIPGENKLDPFASATSSAAAAPIDSPKRKQYAAMGSVTDLDQIFSTFKDPHQEWRRLVAEFVGTFFLVLVAAGAPMMGVAVEGSVHRLAAVVAPGWMVMGVIMAFGKISGAHLNPSVSIAFALRGDFPWRRVPGYIVMQLLGASVAGWFLQYLLDTSAAGGSTIQCMCQFFSFENKINFFLNFGLLTMILGTASGAQSIGGLAAIGVGFYIALAGMWGSPVSGASMNPARTFGPNMASLDFTAYWAYVAGPILGGMLAVGVAYLLRGKGGGWMGSAAAQGSINVKPKDPNLI